MQYGYRYFSDLHDSAIISEALVALEEFCVSVLPGDPRWDKYDLPLSNLKPHRNPGVSSNAIAELPFYRRCSWDMAMRVVAIC